LRALLLHLELVIWFLERKMTSNDNYKKVLTVVVIGTSLYLLYNFIKKRKNGNRQLTQQPIATTTEQSKEQQPKIESAQDLVSLDGEKQTEQNQETVIDRMKKFLVDNGNDIDNLNKSSDVMIMTMAYHKGYQDAPNK